MGSILLRLQNLLCYHNDTMHPSSLLVPLALANGCVARVEGEVPLTDAHKIEMAELLRQEALARPMALELARNITVGAVDAKGTPSTPEKLAVDMSAAADWLHAEYAAGRIMEADTSAFSTDDAIAQYDLGDTEATSDDHIVVASDSALWSVGTMAHEAGHRWSLHNVFVTQAIRDSGGRYNAGFADAAIVYHDFPFMTSGVYAVPGDIIRANQQAIDDARAKAEATADSGDWLTAMQELKEDLEMRTPEEADAHIREIYAEQGEMFEQFGGSMDTIVGAYFDSGRHEALTAERDECRAEFHAEYVEHLAESRRERKVW